MNEDIQHNSASKHAKMAARKGKSAVIAALVCALLVFLAGIGYYAYSHNMVERFIPGLGITSSEDIDRPSFSDEGSTGMQGEVEAQDQSLASVEPSFSDRAATAAQQLEEQGRINTQQASGVDPNTHDGIPTPLIAQYDDVLLHSPIHASKLEGILFHQASFETALPLSTQLPDADPEAMLENPDYEIADEQPEGDEWLVAKALHLWREDTPTAMDTSIDVGAEAGTEVYAPVTGTVVLVTTYSLYDTCEDYEIHIQPDGRSDLDVVEIHIQDVLVKAGERVTGGQTPIAKVRDLAAEDITDIQIGFYTKEGHGNHTHVQVNNADYPEYRETRLKGAYKVKD